MTTEYTTHFTHEEEQDFHSLHTLKFQFISFLKNRTNLKNCLIYYPEKTLGSVCSYHTFHQPHLRAENEYKLPTAQLKSLMSPFCGLLFTRQVLASSLPPSVHLPPR